MPASLSQRAIAAVSDESLRDENSSATASAGKKWTPVFIVASPRPSSGKTFLARLAADFLRLDGGEVKAFDLNPADSALADHLPACTTKADLGNTKGQMALFDALITPDGIGKVLDLGHAAFERFFTVAEEINFVDEARRRSIEPVVLFAADPHPASVKVYADLQRQFPRIVIVPVFNEAITKGQKIRGQFPSASVAAVPLQISLLPPALKAHADKALRSFAEYHETLPVEIPLDLAFELRSWTKRAFLEFRELELRLLLEKLRASLKG